MDGLAVGYLAAFAVGGIAVLSALLLTDIGHGDGMPFLGLTSLSAALNGAGAGGFAASALGIAVPELLNRNQQTKEPAPAARPEGWVEE
ncbi:hypothetical protein HNP40_000442 [Mycobacteroides chelonae]|nr:hypothetical protein [Mycobacteroides chelonae]